jgi:hypothetical protein
MAPAATIDETNTKELFPRGGWDTHHHIFERKGPLPCSHLAASVLME